MNSMHTNPGSRLAPKLRRRATRAAAIVAAATAGLGFTAVAASAIEFRSVGMEFTDYYGRVSRQAGAHPDVRFSFTVPQRDPDNPFSGTVEQPYEMKIDLPPGLIGNPLAFPTCSATQLKATPDGAAAICPMDAQIGYAEVFMGSGFPWRIPVFNIEAPAGRPALFAMTVAGVIVKMAPKVRPTDFGITLEVGATSQAVQISGADVTLWGVPADDIHDRDRWSDTGMGYMQRGARSQSRRVPFLSAPTACPGAPLTFGAWMDGWVSRGRFAHATFTDGLEGTPFVMTGCEQLPFDATMRVSATSRAADSPSGLDVDLSVLQTDGPDSLATAHVRTVQLTLPAGMSVSPSSAAGLGACSPAEIGLGTDAAPSCPASSKLGSVQIDTALLAEPMTGEVILARQGDNPFRSLLALYLHVEGSGVRVKLPGRIDPDPVSGQLVATFDNNPQLPFDRLRVRFDSGPQAALATPAACGTYTSHAEISSWSGRVVGSDSPMVIDQGCATGGFAPGFSAGSVVPAGGASSPFTLSFSRRDGEQLLSALDVELPRGLLAEIASVPLCAEAQAAAGTCGEASRVGHTSVLAGPGPAPLSIPEPGKAPTGVFLSGPYKGAPFSLSILVPAQAGPFDLGNVVVRAALHVDRRDAHVTVRSDPIPSIVQGIPLRLREVTVNMDRGRFMVNPTNCTPMQVVGKITSLLGAAANVSSRYQVGDCATLPFKPRMTFRVGARGKTSNGKRTPFEARLWMTPGQANNRSIEVTLPKTLNARLDVVDKRTACTIEQFQADRCPQVVGVASAVTPLLKDPLRGAAYFVYNPERRLPDLVVRLKGQVNVDLVGKVTITKALELQTTFDTIPDVPITQFQLSLMSGPRNGPIGVTRNLCAASTRKALAADLAFTAQSNKKISRAQKISVAGCGRASRASGSRAGRGRSASKAKRAGRAGRAGK